MRAPFVSPHIAPPTSTAFPQADEKVKPALLLSLSILWCSSTHFVKQCDKYMAHTHTRVPKYTVLPRAYIGTLCTQHRYNYAIDKGGMCRPAIVGLTSSCQDDKQNAALSPSRDGGTPTESDATRQRRLIEQGTVDVVLIIRSSSYQEPAGFPTQFPTGAPTAQHILVRSGSCVDAGLLPINDVSECENAAVPLDFADTTVTTTTATGRPEGCYLYKSASLWLASNTANVGNGAQKNDGNTRYPICQVVTKPILVRSGSCVDAGLLPINKVSECENAAVPLDFDDTTASTTTATGRPRGLLLVQ